MQHDVNYKMPDFDDIYADVKYFIKESDLAFINLEFPIFPSRPPSSYPNFNAHPPYVKAAIDAGFNVFALANNHSNDMGIAGMLSTLEIMKDFSEKTESSPIYYSGLRSSPAEDFPLTVIKLGNKKAGFISVTNIINSKNGISYMDYINYYEIYSGRVNEEKRDDFLRRVSEYRKECDFLIVGIHDGLEYKKEPEIQRREFYRTLVLAGADIVWGHHSHTLQPAEKVILSEENRKIFSRGEAAFIIYSAGNFVSGQTWRLKPSDKNSERAGTGDGVFWKINIMEKNNMLKIVSASPFWINNYKHSKKRMITGFTEDLMNDSELTHEWQEYYKYRLTIQKEFEKVNEWIP